MLPSLGIQNHEGTMIGGGPHLDGQPQQKQDGKWEKHRATPLKMRV